MASLKLGYKQVPGSDGFLKVGMVQLAELQECLLIYLKIHHEVAEAERQ
jgi:hypothetical protein